jgi:tetratricopeptide (TPR) repeat protein
MPEEADAALKKFVEKNPTDMPQYLTAIVYQALGKKAESEKILREIIAQAKDKENYLRYAHIYVMLGDKDSAFELLEKSFQRRDIQILTFAVDPQWDELSSDPRYQDLIKRIGLPQ